MDLTLRRIALIRRVQQFIGHVCSYTLLDRSHNGSWVLGERARAWLIDSSYRRYEKEDLFMFVGGVHAGTIKHSKEAA